MVPVTNEEAGLRGLCQALKAELSALGVCVSTALDDGVIGTLASSNSSYDAFHELQFTAGEGPTYEALETGYPVLVPNLEARFEKWPGYVSAAIDAGTRGVFALPLHRSKMTLAALTVYASRRFDDDELNLVVKYADVATDVLLRNLQHNEGVSGTGSIDLIHGQDRVFQAQGMVMAQLGVSLQDALVRMRADAFATGRTLTDTAHDILNRNLKLGDDA